MIDRPLSAKIYVPLLDPEAIGTSPEDEVSKDYLLGNTFNVLPFEKINMFTLYVSLSLGWETLIPVFQKRLIVDLATPHPNSEHFSINSNTFDQYSCALPYVGFTTLSKILSTLGNIGDNLNDNRVITYALKQLSIDIGIIITYALSEIWLGLWNPYPM